MSNKVHLARCGHRTKPRGTIAAFGESHRTTLKFEAGHIDYCHGCISRMAIKCPNCRGPIFIGASVAECFNAGLASRMSDTSRMTDAGGLIVCRRSSCDWLNAGRIGIWALDSSTDQGHFVPSSLNARTLHSDEVRVA